MSVYSKMTALADAIRAKSGNTGKMGIVAMTEAVNKFGAAVQRDSGFFTTNMYGKAIANCGFQPDLITVYLMTYGGDIEEGFGIPFSEQSHPDMRYCTLSYHPRGIYEVIASRNYNGFEIEIHDLQGSSLEPVRRKEFEYKAVKFT